MQNLTQSSSRSEVVCKCHQNFDLLKATQCIHTYLEFIVNYVASICHVSFNFQGLTRLTFQPYTFQQLQEIVTSRMTGLKVFEPDAIQLAARKVQYMLGILWCGDVCGNMMKLGEV